MASGKKYVITVLAALILGGCSVINDALFPAETSQPGAGAQGTAAAPQTAGEAATSGAPAPAAVSSTPEAPMAAGQGAGTGTLVGQTVTQLRGDLQRLRSNISAQEGQFQQIRAQVVQDAETYHGTVAAVEARLQLGTTPGNPILTKQWSEAQSELDRINSDVLQMNRLSEDVSADASLAGYLVDSVRAARTLSGGVDEDFRHLTELEDETNATTVQVDRLLTELSNDIQRQQQYMANERGNLNVLALGIKSGQLYGGSLSFGRPGGGTALAAVGPADRPLVVIRFDRPNVNYENALYTAVKSALDRRPSAAFEVVAVSSSSGSAAASALSETASRRGAEQVARSLTQMGLPSDRVRLSTMANPSVGPAGEVQVFVR